MSEPLHWYFNTWFKSKYPTTQEIFTRQDMVNAWCAGVTAEQENPYKEENYDAE
jgi:hypothetical protein